MQRLNAQALSIVFISLLLSISSPETTSLNFHTLSSIHLGTTLPANSLHIQTPVDEDYASTPLTVGSGLFVWHLSPLFNGPCSIE
ncbi:hypothetical protein BLOT_003075 [Blomia tropicalis]|nr:hypothetical protein BLOT_003075 [Blomia tropicalis]